MTIINIASSEFFQAGGTLNPGSRSYVRRPADDELLGLTLAGRFCYVLSPRQMGKSSLMVRTALRLREQGVHTAIIELTEIGARVSAEQWYLGLLSRLKSKLKLSINLEAWWAERASFSLVQRFVDFLHDVVLAEIKDPVVVFIDEIDTTLNLDFSDDFFAAIRSTYNARASDPTYERLTFVLLGVATPADLVKDPSRTPFNIGQGIDLREFRREDAQILQQGLETMYPEQAESIFTRIFYWTNGHPYLTQKLFLSIAETEDIDWHNERIDQLVETSFLSEKARKETNLQFIRDGIRSSPNLPKMMSIYRQVYEGKKVPDDERSLEKNRLKLLGLVKSENETLKVRNEIYRRVFNAQWIKENLPSNWRQVATKVALAVAIIAILLGLGINAYNKWAEIKAQECIAQFFQAKESGAKLTCLADLFNLQGILDFPDYDSDAIDLFYGMTMQEQLNLFKAGAGEQSDVVIVVKSIYETLADMRGEGNSDRLLTAMKEAIDNYNQPEGTKALSQEIQNWLDARTLVRKQELHDAISKYDKAIDLNENNVATRYERARIWITLQEYEKAARDLDYVLSLAARAPSPEPTTTSSPSQPITTTVAPKITLTVTKEPTITISINEDLTPKPSPTAEEPRASPTPTMINSISPEFVTTVQIRKAVGDLINDSPELVVFLARSSDSDYLSLRKFGLIPSSPGILFDFGFLVKNEETGEFVEGIEGGEYYSGQEIRFYFTPVSEGYAYMFSLDTSGKFTPLWPDYTSREATPVQAGFEYTTNLFRLDQSEGQEQFFTVISTESFSFDEDIASYLESQPLPDGKGVDPVIKQLKLPEAQFAQRRIIFTHVSQPLTLAPSTPGGNDVYFGKDGKFSVQYPRTWEWGSNTPSGYVMFWTRKDPNDPFSAGFAIFSKASSVWRPSRDILADYKDALNPSTSALMASLWPGVNFTWDGDDIQAYALGGQLAMGEFGYAQSNRVLARATARNDGTREYMAIAWATSNEWDNNRAILDSLIDTLAFTN